MDSGDDTPKGWVSPFGNPRINACSRLPAAYRSVPRPSSPPGTKASTKCPSRARDPGIPQMSAGPRCDPPCTGTIHTGQPRNSRPHFLSTHHASERIVGRRQSGPHEGRRSDVTTLAPRSAPEPDSPCQRSAPKGTPRRMPSPRLRILSLPRPAGGMEVIGLEPTTPCLQSRCSPS